MSKGLEMLNQNGEAKYGKQCSSMSVFDVYGVGSEIESRKTKKRDYPLFLWFNFLMIFFAFFLSRKIEA